MINAPMNSDTIHRVLLNVAGTSSRLDKEQTLTAMKSSPLFIRVLQYAYDPFKQFYIGTKKLAELRAITSTGGETFTDSTFELLDALSDRTISGDAAMFRLRQEMGRLSYASGSLLLWILKKDLRAGFTEGTINKVFGSGTIPDFPYMRCSLPDKSNLSKWNWDKKHISQMKADGMFANVNIDDDGNVVVTSRQGTPIPTETIPGFEAALSQALTWGTQTHGEILISEDGVILPREIGNGIMNSVVGGAAMPSQYRAHYYAWDQIPLQAVKLKGKFMQPYGERLLALANQLAGDIEPGELPTVDLIETRMVASYAEAFEHYVSMLNRGLEGTVLKHRDAIWKDGTSKDQVKFKLEVDVDLAIIDIEQADPGSKHAGRPGALVCQTLEDDLIVRVAIKNEAMRDEVERDRDDWIGRIVVVRSNQLMSPSEPGKPHSLFLPRLVEANYRTDKTVADSLEQVRDQFAAAMKGKA